MTTPSRSRSDERVTSRRSSPPMRTAPRSGRSRRATSEVKVVLPAPEGPTRATSWPGSTVTLTPCSTSPPARRSPLAVASSEASDTSSPMGTGRRRRRARRPAPVGQRRRRPALVDERLEVEHLEDALERDERRHDVDPDVGQRGQGPVEPGEQRGQGQERPDRERPVDGHDAAEAVDQRGGQRGDEGQRRQEDGAVDGDLDADVADSAGRSSYSASSRTGSPKSLTRELRRR